MVDGLWPWLTLPLSQGNCCLNPCCHGRWSVTPYKGTAAHSWTCLNPCCHGRWSMTRCQTAIGSRPLSLNPCCHGRWSMTLQVCWYTQAIGVLILVVMVDGLWHRGLGWPHRRWRRVLILVVMVDGLWLNNYYWQTFVQDCLNPCCLGRWSMTSGKVIKRQPLGVS